MRSGSSTMRMVCLLAVFAAAPARASVGDPQVRTDHVWYPGELACSTFERLFATQAEVYRRVVGVAPQTDEQKALAAWIWRNTHYAHGEEGAQDLWGQGFTAGGDLRNREYWAGLFANGFGLCGTTHSQWAAEMEALLGHGRGRGVGVEGHNSFEVFLSGGAYGAGRWALLDHDISTVIFSADGSRLLSIPEVKADWQRLTDRTFMPEKQHGWLVCGLDARDGGVYQRYDVAEYAAGYSGAPPIVHLRRGETLRRYLRPGLEDGKTFVFWGRNYQAGGIPGPERSQTWVNQPEKLFRSPSGTGYHPGQARYGNAVYTYRPDFKNGDYRESAVGGDADQVLLEFVTPYIIGATPPNDEPWGVYDRGGRNGLVLRGRNGSCEVSVSTDGGRSWQGRAPLRDGLDLTDWVKGRRQYLLRFRAGPQRLADAGIVIRTVCQANAAVLPRLKDGGSQVTFLASGKAVVSAGPTLPLAQSRLVAGAFGTPEVTLELPTPHGEPAAAVYAAAHVFSGNPPDPSVKYQIEYSADGGKSWQPVAKDWTVARRGEEPADFWSQSLCWGAAAVVGAPATGVRLRFRNDGGKAYGRAEAHLLYQVARPDSTRVTFAWTEDGGARQASHVFAPGTEARWAVPTGRGVQTRWVEFEPVIQE